MKFDYNKIYYKVTNKEEIHHGLQYHNGLVKDLLPFNDDKTASCVPGGIYFSDIQHIFEFMGYGVWVRPIKIKKKEKVILDPEGNKWRAHTIFMNSRIDKNTFIKKMMPKKIKGSLDLSGCDLKGITLPQSVGGSLDLSRCDLKGITLPQSVGGYLDLSRCDLKGITLPQSVGGYLYLRGRDLKGIDEKLLKKYNVLK